jgi:hypothetical protein
MVSLRSMISTHTEAVPASGAVYMVFEHMDPGHDLTGVLSQSQFTSSDAHLRSLCDRMLAGLAPEPLIGVAVHQ